ncbi:hypothetical protein EDD64_102115 [Effusibacillus lacus]|nr:hypothetical protein EDD64_102115 [Effusibacillus lacus]
MIPQYKDLNRSQKIFPGLVYFAIGRCKIVLATARAVAGNRGEDLGFPISSSSGFSSPSLWKQRQKPAYTRTRVFVFSKKDIPKGDKNIFLLNKIYINNFTLPKFQ